MIVRCLSFRPITKGALLGFCDLAIPEWGIVIRDCKLMETGSRWISLPSTSYPDKTGQKQWRSTVEFSDKNLRDIFNRNATEAIEQFRASGDNIHRFKRRA